MTCMRTPRLLYYGSVKARRHLPNNRLSVLRAVRHPPPSTMTPTSATIIPTLTSSAARLIAVIKPHITRSVNPLRRRRSAVVTAVAGHRALSAAVSNSSSSSASLDPQNQFRRLSSRRNNMP